VIRAHFGIDKAPFSREGVSLLAAQQDIFDTLRAIDVNIVGASPRLIS